MFWHPFRVRSINDPFPGVARCALTPGYFLSPLRGDEKPMAKIHYTRVDEFWRKEEKYVYLDEKQHVGNVEWQELQPDAKGNWLTRGMEDEFGPSCR
jgi:predicted helicase